MEPHIAKAATLRKVNPISPRTRYRPRARYCCSREGPVEFVQAGCHRERDLMTQEFKKLLKLYLSETLG